MEPLLSIRSLRVEAASASGRIVAVDKLDLDVRPGDIVGLIGESGSGKTTAVRSIIGLLARNVHIVDGCIRFQDRVVYGENGDDLKSIRGRHVGMVFQSASISLNPLMRITVQLKQVLKANRPDLSDSEIHERMTRVMSRMGFAEPERVLRSYPHQLSGGMRQRAAIAIAIASEPELVIADECTSALDVTTQKEVIELLQELTTDLGTALIFVTHDLLLAAELCTRIVVMYGGEVVESGTVDQVIKAPRHPYTRALLRSVPSFGKRSELLGIDGTPPRVQPGFVGCRFADRCGFAVAECRAEDVAWSQPPDDHGFRCILPHGTPIDAKLRAALDAA